MLVKNTHNYIFYRKLHSKAAVASIQFMKQFMNHFINNKYMVFVSCILYELMFQFTIQLFVNKLATQVYPCIFCKQRQADSWTNCIKTCPIHEMFETVQVVCTYTEIHQVYCGLQHKVDTIIRELFTNVHDMFANA